MSIIVTCSPGHVFVTPPRAHATTALQILLDAQGGLKVVIPEEPPENSGLLAVFVDNSNM